MGVLSLDVKKIFQKQEDKEDTLFSRLQVDGKEDTKETVGYRTRPLLGTNRGTHYSHKNKELA